MNTHLSLEDMECANDIGLLSSGHNDMQEKTDTLATVARQIGLNR